MSTIKSSNLGYPRIGENREWKRALESYWNGEINETELFEKTDAIRLNNLQKQKEQGIDIIPVADFSIYNHVLETSETFIIIPYQYEYNGGEVVIKTYIA